MITCILSQYFRMYSMYTSVVFYLLFIVSKCYRSVFLLNYTSKFHVLWR